MKRRVRKTALGAEVTTWSTEKKKQFICSICGKEASGWSCNAQPVNDGRCCGDCDRFIVLPHRIRIARRQQLAEQKAKE